MNTETKKPLDTIRDGSLKATIWQNPGKADKPPFYSVKITRLYKDEKGVWHDSDSFSGTELLQIARLANLAYTNISVYKARDRAERQVAGSAA